MTLAFSPTAPGEPEVSKDHFGQAVELYQARNLNQLLHSEKCDGQKVRKPKLTYLEQVKASMKADQGLKQTKINQALSNSAKVAGSRRSAVPIMAEVRSGNFSRSCIERER